MLDAIGDRQFYRGREIPCTGVHLDCPASTVGWWTTWDTPDLDLLAERWPGWRLEFWRDDYLEQVRRCRGAFVLPDVDLNATLDDLRTRVDGRSRGGLIEATRARIQAKLTQRPAGDL
jgi:hypothetical protein